MYTYNYIHHTYIVHTYIYIRIYAHIYVCVHVYKFLGIHLSLHTLDAKYTICIYSVYGGHVVHVNYIRYTQGIMCNLY